MPKKAAPHPWYDTKNPAAKLCQLANKKGLPITYVVENFTSDLKKAKIKITSEIIHQAQALERQWEAHIRNRVWNLRGQWNGLRYEDAHGERRTKQSATLSALLAGQKVSKAKRQTA